MKEKFGPCIEKCCHDAAIQEEQKTPTVYEYTTGIPYYETKKTIDIADVLSIALDVASKTIGCCEDAAYENRFVCFNCQSFAHWDGDFCCCDHMKIHQYANDFRMNKSIDNTCFKVPVCEDFVKCENNTHSKMYWDEYKRWIKFRAILREIDDRTGSNWEDTYCSPAC